MSGERTLVIVGAGPKAIAIAAKSHVLAELGIPVPRIHIIERHAVGAHWSGDSGYTNGLLRLGTSPEKDVGFPYQSRCWGRSLDRLVDERMAGYSWQSFLIATGAYSDWVDRGRPQPQHREWAHYLQWVAGMIAGSFKMHQGEVRRLEIRDQRWVVGYRGADGSREVEADGLVMTGPGRTKWPNHVRPHPRVLTVESFWSEYQHIQQAGPTRIAIIGSGENAATIAMSLTSLESRSLHIDIVSWTGMTYSRGESFRENRVYSNPDVGRWSKLNEQDRRSFIRRTDRGVFSVAALKVLDQADNIDILPGRVRLVTPRDDGGVHIHIEYNGHTEPLAYDHVVIATGSDQAAHILRMLTPEAEEELRGRLGLEALSDRLLEPLIEPSLAVRGLRPLLHLPMLAGMAQGPGFANLSCLGRLSDQLLGAYVEGYMKDLDGARHPSGVLRRHGAPSKRDSAHAARGG
jgi:mycobactin lysine-N-oxygenase